MLYFIPQLVCWTLLLIASLVTPDNWLRPAAFVAAIAVLIPLQSAVVRRLHDMAKPGWLVVPFSILSAIAMWVAWVGTGPIYPANNFWHNRDELRLLYGASWLAMIVVLMMPPKDENNPYGPNPRPAEKTI